MNTLAYGILWGAVAFVIYMLDFIVRWRRRQVWSYSLEGCFVLVITMAFGCLVDSRLDGMGGASSIATERNATEQIPAERIAAKPSPSEWKATEPNATERNERFERVFAAIGPPPVPNAVPVEGYVTKAGLSYPPRWRTPPDADKGNNLKGSP